MTKPPNPGARTDPARHWALDPRFHHLNHGSFGACPTPILAVQARLREQLEANAMTFFVRDLEALWDAARRALADFVGAAPESVVLIPNATFGVNTILRSLAFAPGDEILVSDHEYNACRNAVDFVAQRAGAHVVIVPLPFPIQSPEEVLEAVEGRTTERTRLLLIDHVTSATGLILPVAELVREMDQRGIDTLVDGAHGPGMLDLNLDQLGAAYYTGNCHKWLCTPKGAGMLYVRPDKQSAVRPLSISHGANCERPDRSRFHLEFDWTGTADPTAALCIPAAIEFMGGLLPGGWPELRQRNHELVVAGRRKICSYLGLDIPAPEQMLGSLAAIILGRVPPESLATASPYQDPLERDLIEEDGIIVPAYFWPAPPRRIVRISAQIYNRIEQYDALAQALSQKLART